jgi:hypothetical protein
MSTLLHVAAAHVASDSTVEPLRGQLPPTHRRVASGASSGLIIGPELQRNSVHLHWGIYFVQLEGVPGFSAMMKARFQTFFTGITIFIRGFEYPRTFISGKITCGLSHPVNHSSSVLTVEVPSTV